MLRVVGIRGLCLASLLWVALLPRAYADDPPGPPPQPKELVTPPRLVRFVEATYPPEAEAAQAEAKVELELTIGADGRVSEAIVVLPVGQGFDEAAKLAAMQFLFEPARRDWKPVSSRIRYRYVFEIKSVDLDDIKVGSIVGQLITSKPGGLPEPARVELVAKNGEVVQQAESDADGRFRFDSLEPGEYRVEVYAGNLGNVFQVEKVEAGQATEVKYRLGRKDTDEGSFGATAVIEPPPREVIRRSLDRDELLRIPGTRGDALRAIEIFPGVARPPFGLGLLIIRGSAPGDSEAFIDGISVPLLYHFGGLTSVFNSRFLQQIDFYPGNFSSRYGRRIGGIIEVKTRDPAEDRFHGIAEFSVIDTYALAEGPITDKLSIAGGIRRSLIDLALKAFSPDDVAITQAPVYFDYQFLLTWKPTNKDRFRFLSYGSNDRLELLFDEATGDDPTIRGDAGFLASFYYNQLEWDRRINSRVQQDIDIMTGPIRLDFNLSDEVVFRGKFWQTYARSEWRAQLTDKVRITGGLDLVFFAPSRLFYEGPQPPANEGGGSQQDPIAGAESVFVDTQQNYARPGVYLESALTLGDVAQLILGMRLDYFSDITSFAFDPRLTTIFSVRDDMRLKVGVGLYSQAPEFQESNAQIGNPNLKPIRSVHVGGGWEYDPFPGMRFGVEGFYKYLWDRAISTPNGQEPFFVTGGIGRIYGAEFSAHIRPATGRRYFGYLAYTLSRSERKDGPLEPWRLFDFDQTHILTAAFVYKFKRNWEIGGTFRLVSGSPTTPVVGSVYDSLNDVYQPIDGRINSIRNPLFHRFDLRVQKEWIFQKWKLALFLDIQNLYNQKNQEGTIYSFDFRQSTPLIGLPLIPSLGLRGEI